MFRYIVLIQPIWQNFTLKKKSEVQDLLPSKTTVNFILSYSKALKMVKVGRLTFENLSN